MTEARPSRDAHPRGGMLPLESGGASPLLRRQEARRGDIEATEPATAHHNGLLSILRIGPHGAGPLDDKDGRLLCRFCELLRRIAFPAGDLRNRPRRRLPGGCGRPPRRWNGSRYGLRSRREGPLSRWTIQVS